MGLSDTPSQRGEGQEPEQGSHEWAERLRVTEYFRARLSEEVRRAERYGRRFAVVFVNCENVGARRVFNNIRPRMRCTDIVEVIRSQTVPAEKPRGGRDQVAMILPETSKTGAQTAVGRVEVHLSDMGALRFGVAYYPDDSTNPHQLFAIARRQAEETLRP
jgi:GGDEF domain-containing protein